MSEFLTLILEILPIALVASISPTTCFDMLFETSKGR